MPVIKQLKTSKMSTQVRTGTADFGGSASYQALSNLGAVGEKIATDRLQVMKEDEARTYSMDSMREKSVGREQFIRDMQYRLQANDGKIGGREGIPVTGYEGLYYSEAINKWEAEKSETIGENAPTELAKRYFDTKDGPSRLKSSLSADNYQATTVSAYKKVVLKDTGEANAKGLAVYAPKNGEESTYNRGNSTILGYISEVNETQGLFPDEREALISNYAGQAAKSTLTAQMNNRNFTGAATSLGLFDMNDTELTLLMTELSQTTGRKYISAKKDADGNVVTHYLKEGETRVKTDKNGVATNVEQQIIPRGLDVSGTYKEKRNLIKKYLTPEEHRRGLTKLFNQKRMSDTSKGRAVVKATERTILAFKTPDKAIRIDSGSAEGKQLFKTTAFAIDKSGLPPEKRHELYMELLSGVIVGDTMDLIGGYSTARANKIINDNVNSILPNLQKMVGDIGLGEQEAIAFGVDIRAKASHELKALNQRLDSVRGTNKHMVESFNLGRLQDNAFSYGSEAGVDKAEWDKYVESIDSAAKQVGEKPNYFPTNIIDRDVEFISQSLKKGEQANIMDIVSYAWLRSNVMGPLYPEWVERLDRESKTITGVELSLPLLFSKDNNGYQAAIRALNNKVHMPEIVQGGKEADAKLTDFILEAKEQLEPHRTAILQSGQYGGNWNAYKHAGETVALEAMTRYLKDPRRGGDDDGQAFTEATTEAMNMMIHKQTNLVKEDINYVSTPVSILKANNIQYDPDTGKSPTMEAAVRYMYKPETFMKHVDFEKKPYIKAYLDDAKIKGKKDRTEKVLELLEGDNLMLKVTNNKVGVVMQITDPVNKVPVDVYTLPFKDISGNAGVQAEEKAGAPAVEKAFRFMKNMGDFFRGK